ncbi:collagen alpha-6(VI) chain-like isoform X2 [Varanus komodoensis]|uniref:collagen alpha-6(VI) chain-like isoform X2 n=1 Tax=Varanus komodoensis TaxID=61221 RepID=UPI001CF7A966|nr:collagen alpha-6(VI) chain-like isoform X2 [Varanus komodoensis]
MDNWKPFLILIGLTTLCSTDDQITVCQKATVADIVFLVDSSTSIGLENFEKVKDFLYTLISSFYIGHDQIRIGLAQYSDIIFPEFMLNKYSSKDIILEHIKHLTFRGGSSYTGAALDFITTDYFIESAGSRAQKNIPQMVILFTDGGATDEVKLPASKLRAKGISIYVVGVDIQNTTELKEMASKPFNKFLFTIDNFDLLQDLTSSLLQTVCFDVKSQIEVFTKHYADVIFLLDSSDSMGSFNFKKAKEFVAKNVEQLDIGADKYRVGLAQYSGEGRIEFFLNTYERKEDILNHIQSSTEFMGGNVWTGAALRFLREVYFTEEAGSRFSQGVPQFTVVVTSATLEDDFKEAEEELKEMGVNVVTVDILGSDMKQMGAAEIPGIGVQTSEVEIDLFQKNIVDILEVPVQQQYYDAIEAQVPAACSSASVADIVFLVDESSRIGQGNFHLIRVFLLTVISALDIAPDNVRVALVLYSDKPRLEFSLDTFEDKSEILNYVKRLPYRGGQAYMGAALDFLSKKVFTKAAGSRKNQGVQQLAVVITDGQSQDNFTEIASNLRRSGVTVYALGIQNISDNSQLHKIASYPPRKHVTNLGSFLQLSNLKWRIKKRLCNEIVTQAFATPVQFRILKEGCKETEQADIYFLIDGSGSIYPNPFNDMKVFMNELISMFQVGTNRVRFGVVQYGSNPQTEFMINQYNTVLQLKEAIKVIRQIGGGTRTGDALKYMLSLFKRATRENVPQFLIIITDGQSEDKVIQAAEELRKENIVIYAIGVKDANKTELEDIAGTKDRVFFVNEFDSLKTIKHEIVQEICSPEACKNLKADIILLIDTSESMNRVQFNQTLGFIHSIVNMSDVGVDKVQIGLLQFSSNPKEEFPLKRHNNKADLRKAISEMKQLKEGTKTGKALDFASPYFDESKGGRSGVNQYLIVVTDGESDDEVERPAKSLRNKGVVIFAIGISKANTSQLREIAGSQDKVYSEDDFVSLMPLDKKIFFRICNPEEVCKRTELADIIFVVHGSRDITELQFKSIQWLMEAIVNNSLVGQENVQFGAVVYSNTPKEEFPLNRYSTKLQVREAISKLTPLRGPTFTARALNFARKRFGEAHSGRTSLPGVTRMIVLITDEPTTAADRPHLPAAVQALNQEGIHIIAIGMHDASRTELEEIGGDKRSSFFAPSYNQLEGLHKTVTQVICDGSKPVCGTQMADLVFLIDGSGSISDHDFATMKTFMKEIVDSFIIAQDKVRIGVAQFGKNPKEEFYLNTFYTDVAIKGKIDTISQLKGSTFTGNALRFVRRFFEPANGGRKNKDVLQALIVITDGKSNDSVTEAAIALRRDGIQVFAIGIATPNNFELLQIAGDAKRVYVVETFNMLEIIERKLVTEICDSGDRPRQDCNIDISVGVDISGRTRPPSALRLRQQMQTYLPWLMQQQGSMLNISCTAESPVNIRFRYQVFDNSGQALFDSDFEKYNDEIIQKFLAVQTTVDTYLDKDFLQSFWDRSLSLTSAKVKVLLAFTDGPDESIEMLKTTVDSLRRKGLSAFLIIGLENFQEFHELQEIEFGRGFEYHEPLHIGNPALPGMLWRTFDTIAERECCRVCCKCLGQAGIQGIPGPGGREGNTGFKGYPGHPGDEGVVGDRGPTGMDGKQGEAGCPGSRGSKGARGYRGSKGEDGDFGIDGIDGEEGEKGSPGSSGQKGTPGRRGREGPIGEPGERGESGIRGDNGIPGIDNEVFGPPGTRGKTGRQGEIGADGVQGESGAKGLNGRVGRRGPPGLKGVRGNEGEAGHPAESGPRGYPGTKGQQGIPGPIGPHGLPGLQGSPGIKGESGSAGKVGHMGRKGEHGDPGEKGIQGLPGLRGLPGFDGEYGYGLPGRKGAKGQHGFPGNPGPQGEDGDQGIPGDRGAKGSRGQRANAGMPGAMGDRGDRGPPGRMGQKGEKSIIAMTPCELVNLTRGNCPCCIGVSQCPVYPTEVVFALDMSADVTQVSFQRMKRIMMSLLRGIQISKSNCPTGARVSVLSYNTNTKYLIRFSDFKKENLLMEAIQRIPLEKSLGRRNIGEVMRFVARNVFKHYRHGALMRKVAIFLTAGPSEDATSINTAVLEFNALDITPVVIALREVPNVRQAFLTDDTAQLFVWESNDDENLDSISHCALCFDKCNPAPECEMIVPFPIPISMDITYIIDSSRNVGSEEFETMKEFVSNMLDYFVIDSMPLEPGIRARVALVQQAPQHFTVDRNSSPVNEEFELVTYTSKEQMKMHIHEKVDQLEGPSAIGHALEWTIKNIFLDAPSPRKHRVIFTLLGSQTSSWDREKLRKMTLEAKCQGFTLFTLALGRGVDDAEIRELSSVPVEQHLLQLGRVDKPGLPYALKFSRAFLNLLKWEINPYPPQGLQEECEGLDRGDNYYQLIGRNEWIPFPELDNHDTFQLSDLPRKSRQGGIMEANQEPEEYKHVENEYFTGVNVRGPKGTRNEEHFQQVPRMTEREYGAGNRREASGREREVKVKMAKAKTAKAKTKKLKKD